MGGEVLLLSAKHTQNNHCMSMPTLCLETPLGEDNVTQSVYLFRNPLVLGTPKLSNGRGVLENGGIGLKRLSCTCRPAPYIELVLGPTWVADFGGFRAMSSSEGTVT